jgi:hypothetical protein
LRTKIYIYIRTDVLFKKKKNNLFYFYLDNI